MSKFGEVRGRIYELTIEGKSGFGDTQVTIYDSQEVVMLHQMGHQGDAKIFLYPAQIEALRNIILANVTPTEGEG